MREQQKCMELCLGPDDEPTDSLWVRISGQVRVVRVMRGEVMVAICYNLIKK